MSKQEFQDRLTDALADRYAIQEELGAGGMAMVYVAEDLKHQRKVAVKVLRPELAAALGGERFLREIQIAANLTHPHIVPLYDSGEVDGFLFYVMPYVKGETLRKMIEKGRQLGLDEALRIAGEVADALSFAHDQGLVHRDIKPENILIEAGHAVVADFGLARAISAAGAEKLTETGVVIGTPDYMSPEHTSGDRDIDGRSDIYSLGSMLYEMLAGQPPFIGPTVESVIHQHLVADPPQVTVLRPNVPRQVNTAILRALQKTPADRYQNAKDMGQELEMAAATLRVSGTWAPPAEVAVNGPAEQASSGLRIKPAYLVGAVAAVLAGILVVSNFGPSPGTAGGPIRMTVIPFENLGADDQEYFAAGITDEITARLASVAGLSVVGRQSAARYKNSPKTPQQIGDELGVDYLLEATISWQHVEDGPSTVRVRPQLIRSSDGMSVWGNVYDDDLTRVFEVQTNISEQVVEALGVALLEPEQQALEVRPTENLEAYDSYLRGHDYMSRPVGDDNYRFAERMYQQALHLDPQFAAAAARLSVVHSFMYWYYFDRTEARIHAAREAVDLALAVAPDLPDAQLALGEFYYRTQLDYDRALEQFENVRRHRRDDSELLINIGSVERRQGKWGEAAKHFGEASELELRSASNAVQAGLSYLYLRNYPEANRYFERAVSVAPDQLRPRVWMARLLVTAEGDTAGARAQFEEAHVMHPQVLDPQAWWHWAVFRVLDGSSDGNERRLQGLRMDSAFVQSAAAELYGLRGDTDRMRAHYDSARVVLEGRLRTLPDEARFHSELGVALAGLGRREEAIHEGQTATRLLPVSKEAVLGADWIRNLAQIYTMLGMRTEAVEQLETLLSLESSLSPHWLRLDPIWRPLDGHPGFSRLIAGRGPD